MELRVPQLTRRKNCTGGTIETAAQLVAYAAVRTCHHRASQHPLFKERAMDDVQQLGEMLRHYADSEAHKKRQHQAQSAVWAEQIDALYGQIEQWLAQLLAPGLLELSREAYVAHGPGAPAETSGFKTEKLTLSITGKPVEFVPDVMGAGGSISLSITGLTAARHGSISLICQPPSVQWQWRRTNGLKDADTYVFDAAFLAQQLQSVIPRERS
jgi:hypothetical protein